MIIVRPTRPEERATVGELITAAFATAAHAGGNEAQIAEGVREERAQLVDLVAVEDGRIVGHVLFSRMTCDPPLYVAGLGPVSVIPDQQSKGVGTALIQRGLRECRALGVKAVVVLGHPDYYPRFGFSTEAVAKIASPFAGNPAFMAQALVPGALDGPIKADFPAAFG